MRGSLANHLADFIAQVNAQIAEAKVKGTVPTPELARERLASLSEFVTDIPELALVVDRELITETHTIPVKVYSPDPETALPVVTFFHGGGHMCGNLELYDPMCRKIALSACCTVISIDYRLSPEHPYPEGLNDAVYAVKNYTEVLTGINYSEQLMIAGDSAGGAICTSLAMKKVHDPELKFSKQILIYPNVDYTSSSASIEENGSGFFLEKARIEWYFDHYFLHNEDRKKASPLYGPIDHNGPESLIILAGCDPLRDEGISYAEKLTQAGVSVTLYQFHHMIHAFMNIENLVPEECKKLYQLIGDFVRDE
ncbi:MAG: alpha/beta hydrolase [Nitrospinaceae bacterium]|jgi:acetyl esterase/lipase|nr:alpha/beta hydrolase [Nitrospinaceae bacterium]|tara:strand:+ start:4384 stop:5316 length:933 start_codon:yes stop_codon:yes gene_type:complete